MDSSNCGRRVALLLACSLVAGNSLQAASRSGEAAGPVMRALVASLPTPEGELVALEEALGPRLAALGAGEVLSVSAFPVGPGAQAELEFSRVEVYAADSRVVAVTPEGVVDLPRSALRFFAGRPAAGGEERVLLTLEGDRAVVREAAVYRTDGEDLRLSPVADGEGWFLLADEPPLPEDATAECGQENTVLAGGADAFPATAGASAGETGITTLHTARIAVDTDNELLSLKFGNNLAAATNYVAALVAGMNVMYERDLLVRLVQGLTILRPSTQPDPYNGSTSTYDGLVQFGNHWQTGCGGLCAGASRALAMMLSGKAPSANSASGIAWVDALCSGSIGYSFSQVFKFAGSTAAHDVKLVGHELGHNFGSPHTHCYSPPIDGCYNGEGGCFSGSPSCPATTTINGVSARGTVMSYCHLLGGCSASTVFHPRSVDRIEPKIAARVGQCIFPAGGGSTPVFVDGFENGSASRWD